MRPENASEPTANLFNVTCTLVSVMVCVSHDFLWRKSVEDAICVTSDMQMEQQMGPVGTWLGDEFLMCTTSTVLGFARLYSQ